MSVRLLHEQAIFEEARQAHSLEARQALLDQRCGQDDELKGRVVALLRASEECQSFLESPPPGLDSVSRSAELPAIERPIAERPGTVIGPYKLLEQIGEGGMGVVFMAEQSEPIRRTVALKIIKPGMDTRQVIARFEAERRALAMMDHPNIARVYDAGATENGRPYFVMELVRGVPITEYCDQCNLPTRDRLELIVTVCRAVQHAHQKGIIHRDIKPTNVMVAMQDGQPAPKIIDFGVAKAVGEQPLTERTLTLAFAQMVGTPLYMSPEQAELSPLGVDTRSDIYSLGVLLYELLTGTTPFDKDRLHAASYDELRRIIREEEPPPPSGRISTLAADLATTVADRRRTEVRRLRHTVSGELDWIVMKCLDKDRNRRYETASGFAADIQRFLNDEPVQACPPSARYRIRKFARRNRVGLAIAAALVLGIAGTSWQSIQATRARNWAVAAEGTANTAAANAVESRRETRRLLYVSDMGMALHAVETNNLDRATRLLDRYLPNGGEDEDLRGFEWYYLWRLCNRHEWTLSNAGPVIGCSPDGKTFAAAGVDSSVRIFDLKTRKLTAILAGSDAWVMSLAFSPSGSELAVAGGDQTVRVWDLRTNQLKYICKGHTNRVNAVIFTPDGSQLISGSADKRVIFWDASTGDEQRTLPKIPGEVTSLAISPDGRTLIVGGGEYHKRGDAILVDVATGKQTALGGTYYMLTVACSPDGKSIATAGRGRTVHVWDTATGKLKFDCGKRDPDWIYSPVYSGHTDWVVSTAFSPDGKYVVSLSADQSLRIWDAATGSLVTSVAACTAKGHSISFIPNQSSFITADQNGTVKRWDLDKLVREERIPLRADDLWSIDASADGALLATSGFRGLKLIDSQTGEVVTAIKESVPEHRSARFSPNGKRLVTSKENGTIEVWSVPEGKLETLLTGHEQPVIDFDFSPDGRMLASASADATARLWDMDKLELRSTLRHDFVWVEDAAFSPDGRSLTTGSNTVRIWDVTTGKLQRVMKGHSAPIWGVAYSPDGKQIASCAASPDNTVKLWNADTGELQFTLRNHRAGVFGVSYLDDKTLASVSHDKTVRLWNLRTGQETLELTGHAHYLWDLDFFKPTKTLYTGGTGGEIRTWRAASETEVTAQRNGGAELQQETAHRLPELTGSDESAPHGSEGAPSVN